jgi:hypothetical protein
MYMSRIYHALQEIPYRKRSVIRLFSHNFFRWFLQTCQIRISPAFICVLNICVFFFAFFLSSTNSAIREHRYPEFPLEWRYYWINSRRKVRNIVHWCNTFNRYIRDLIDDAIRSEFKSMIRSIVRTLSLRVIC